MKRLPTGPRGHTAAGLIWAQVSRSPSPSPPRVASPDSPVRKQTGAETFRRSPGALPAGLLACLAPRPAYLDGAPDALCALQEATAAPRAVRRRRREAGVPRELCGGAPVMVARSQSHLGHRDQAGSPLPVRGHLLQRPQAWAERTSGRAGRWKK